MKRELQRIKAALNQLEHSPSDSSQESTRSDGKLPGSEFVDVPPADPRSWERPKSDDSFDQTLDESGSEIDPFSANGAHTPPSDREPAVANLGGSPLVDPATPVPFQDAASLQTGAKDNSDQAEEWGRSPEGSRVPDLPPFNSPTVPPSSLDPALVLQGIQQIEAAVKEWDRELQQVLERIRSTEAEGPAVQGWLESHTPENAIPKAATLRHADVEELIEYVNEICDTVSAGASLRHRYVLCSYDAQGRIWSRPCPPEQVSDVSLAIARYQTLVQLNERRDWLEKRLRAIAIQVNQVRHQCFS
jgi:hypothetical protein